MTGARSPPGTLRDLTTPSLGTGRAGGGGRRPRRGVPGRRVSPAAVFRAGGVPGRRGADPGGCARAVPGGVFRRGFRAGFSRFRRAGFRAAGVPGRAKKNRVFSVFFGRASRMYKEAAGSFSEKKPLTFRPGRVMDVSAGRETAQKAQPGTRVGREKPPPEERSPP